MELLEKLSLSRRSFVKLAAATAGAAALATGSEFSALAADSESSAPTSGQVHRQRTVCRGCGKMECGVWVTVQDGKAIRVEGDQSSFTSLGHCCTKSQASIQACYHPDRLRFPMKRTRPKGEDPGWERISWDEAARITVDKFAEIIDKYTTTAVFTMNGTSRFWSMGGYGAIGGYVGGAVNKHVASCVCKGPRFLTSSSIDTYASNWMTSGEEPRVYVEWGGNIEYSNYDDSCRNVVNAISKADKFIIIDPRMTGIGKEADYWLNLRPGTDQAIALAWAKIIAEDDNLLDTLYMKRWTNAPFLVVEDMEPSGGWMIEQRNPINVQTVLLKECDLVEGGSYQKFFVHDAAKAKEGKTGNDALSFFDVEVAQWDGEHITTEDAMTKGHWERVGTPWEGWLPDRSEFDSIDPDLVWEGEVTLKDGRTVKAKTVWAMYRDMLSDKTPEWAAGVTGVDASKIRDACLAWATRPAGAEYGNGGIHVSLAIDMAGNAYQTLRCVLMLMHMTGNWDIPGGNRGGTKAFYNDNTSGPYNDMVTYNYNVNLTNNPMSSYDRNANIVGAEDWPMGRWYGQWSEPNSIMKAAVTGSPYPIVGGLNDSGSYFNQGSTNVAWEAMNKLDFWFEANLWHHPTADCADVLVPVYHWIEMRFPRISQSNHCGLGMNIPCVEAPGDTKDDIMMQKTLADAKGVPWTNNPDDKPNPTTKDNCEIMFYKAQLQAAEIGEGFPYKDWDEFEAGYQTDGWQNAKKVGPKIMGTYRRWETGYLALTPGVGGALGCNNFDIPGCDRYRRFGSLTTTTKFEFWPTVVERYCLSGSKANIDRSYLIPDYREPMETPVTAPEAFREYPLNATTGRRIPVYFHSEHRMLPWCRELWPAPRIEINPADAAELGIEQGDWVWIETREGKIRQVADLYYGIDKGVVNLEHAWWFPELSAPNHGEKLCNCNRLLGTENVDIFIATPTMRGFAVKVYKATPENSPFGNPIPCDDDGTEIIHDSTDPRLKEWLPNYSLNGRDY